MTLESVSERTVKIRLLAGGNPHTCPVCGCARSAPARRYVDGKIAEGCVDASHTGWLRGVDLDWHNRPAAIGIRAAVLASMTVRDPFAAALRGGVEIG